MTYRDERDAQIERLKEELATLARMEELATLARMEELATLARMKAAPLPFIKRWYSLPVVVLGALAIPPVVLISMVSAYHVFFQWLGAGNSDAWIGGVFATVMTIVVAVPVTSFVAAVIGAGE